MNDDLWVTASRDTESEDLARRLATARVAAAEVWPFLAAATSEREYVDRKALVRDRIERVAANAAEGDPVLFGVVHTALQEGFDSDFALLHASRVAEAQARQRVAALVTRRAYVERLAGYIGEPGTGSFQWDGQGDIPLADLVNHWVLSAPARGEGLDQAAFVAWLEKNYGQDLASGRDIGTLESLSEQFRSRTAARKQAERSGYWTTPHEEYDAGFAAGQADKAAGVEPRVDLTTLYVRGVDSPLAREVGQGPNYWTQGYAKGYETATAAARKQAGVGDWPRVPSQNFPGETVPACPKCGSTSISIFALPAYQPGTRGMPGGPQLTRCDACGYSDYDYGKGASRRTAAGLRLVQEKPGSSTRTVKQCPGCGSMDSWEFLGDERYGCGNCGYQFTAKASSGWRPISSGDSDLWTGDSYDPGMWKGLGGQASRRTAGLVPADVQEGDTIRVRFQDKNYLTGEVKGEKEYVGTFKFEDSFGIHLDEHTTDGPHTYQNTVSREIPSSSVLSVTKVSARRTAGENPFAKKDDDKAADAPSGDPAAQASWACPQCQGTDAYTQGGKDLAEALAAKEPIKCGSCGNIDNSGGQAQPEQPGDGGTPPAPPAPPAGGAPAATDKPEEKKASRKHAYDSDDAFYDGVQYDTFYGGGSPPLPDEVFRQIQSRDPDGRESEPTQADYDAFEQWIVSTYGPTTRDLYYGYTASRRASRKQAAEGETPMFVVLDADGRVLGMWPTVEEADAMRSTFNGPTTLTQRFYRFSARGRQAATYDYTVPNGSDTRPTFGRDVQVGDVIDIPDAGRARVTGFVFDGDALRYAEVEWLERRREFEDTSPIVLGREDLYSIVAHRRQAANPYQPTANPYVAEPPVSPGMPDDALDGPVDNPLTRIEPPRTTRPRQEPSGAPADYSTAPPPAQQAVTQGFASKSMPHLVQGR